MNAWKRVLIVKLTSQTFKKSLVFGMDKENNDLNITASIHKYMSALKDTATIKISNLTYAEMTEIIMGKFLDVEVLAGYESGNVVSIFNGGLLYISNKLETDKTNTVILLCASKIVASFYQKRLNLTFNSGINLYSAIKFICKMGGVPDSNVSTQLKKDFLKEVTTVNQNFSSWLDSLTQRNSELIVNSDAINGQSFSLFNAARSNNRVINLTPDNIMLTDGYPRLTTEGLTVTLLPTFNFMCGDTIVIDNSILDVSVSNRNNITFGLGALFSQKGQYMIYEMEYTLQNRGNNFKLKLSCKNREKISSYLGGSS